jgi:hypothetical protein
MKGTVLVTGANGSLGLSFVQQLLQNHPSYFFLLTVRNASDQDPNTKKLREIVASAHAAKTSIEVLDLGSLTNVRGFADDVEKRVTAGEIPPLSAVSSISLLHKLRAADFQPSDCMQRGLMVSHYNQILLRQLRAQLSSIAPLALPARHQATRLNGQKGRTDSNAWVRFPRSQEQQFGEYTWAQDTRRYERAYKAKARPCWRGNEAWISTIWECEIGECDVRAFSEQEITCGEHALV